MSAPRRAPRALPAAPASPDARDEVLHVRVWRERRRDFALMTRAFVRAGDRLVEKRALYPEGFAHIDAIGRNAEWMRKTWRAVRLPARRRDREAGAGSVVFDYVEGTPFDRILASAVASRDRAELRRHLVTWVKLLEADEDQSEPLARAAFGPWPAFEDRRRLRHGNLDPVPGNLVRDPGGRYWAVDPEWCLGGPVPAAYVLGRCWLNMTTLLGAPMLSLLPEDEALGILGLSRKDLDAALHLEAAFQTWVFGSDHSARLPAAALRSQLSLGDLLSERARDAERLRQLAAEAEAAAGEREARTKALSALSADLERAREQLAASEADREGRGRLLDAATAELTSVREQLAASEADREGRGTQLSVAAAELASVREQLAASEADREGRGRLLAAASAELQTARTRLEAAEAARVALSADLETSRRASERRAGELEAEVRRLEADRETREAALSRLAGALEASRAAIAGSEADRTWLREALDARGAEIEALRESLRREAGERRASEEERRRLSANAAALGRALETAIEELATESARGTLAIEELQSVRLEIGRLSRQAEAAGAASRRQEEARIEESRRREAVEIDLEGLRRAHGELAAAAAREREATAGARSLERDDWQRLLAAADVSLSAERAAGEELRRALADAQAGHAGTSAELARIHGSRMWRAANVYWRLCRRLGLIR